jgi:hypothetical protein
LSPSSSPAWEVFKELVIVIYRFFVFYSLCNFAFSSLSHVLPKQLFLHPEKLRSHFSDYYHATPHMHYMKMMFHYL